MIRLDEEFISRADGPTEFTRSVGGLLERQWSAYRKARKRCRRDPAPEFVHKLRIEIRRTLSALQLLCPLLPDALSLAGELRAEFKALSKLRDTHVHLIAVENGLNRFPETAALFEVLRKREDRLVRKIAKRLRRKRIGRSTRRIARLQKSLDGQIKRSSSARVERALTASIDSAFAKLAQAHRGIDSQRIKTIHRTRVAFKKFRYMVEAFSMLRPIMPARYASASRRFQRKMGDIQDVDTLLARCEKFARKTRATELESFCAELRWRRQRLVSRFIADADQLLALWPPGPATSRAHQGVKHGVVSVAARHRG